MRIALLSPSSSALVTARTKKPDSSKDPEQSPPRIKSNVKQNLKFLKIWKVLSPLRGYVRFVKSIYYSFFFLTENEVYRKQNMLASIILKAMQEFQKQKSNTARPATSYRKKKAVKEELPEDTELYHDPTMSLYNTNQGLETAVPVLLVDGYNVCGYWAKLKKHFIKGRLDVARQKLVDELISFSVLKEVKVVVVFDAMMSGLPDHKEIFGGIDLIFSTESCADAWIEKEVVALREDGCPKVWVVTSDVCQQHAAHGAGAFVWSCKALVSEIKASQKEFEEIINEHRSTSMQGKILQHNLDREVVDALKDLKKQLSEK